jgi:phosphoribosylaminoimidazole-succinocarboxamide synthase
MEKLYEGKAKILYPEGENLRVYFKDEATAFNAQKRGLIPGKGVVNNKVSSALFRYLQAHGIKTHFIRELSDREMLVKRVEIVPLEVILRYRAAGSFAKRYGVEEGTPLRAPLVEFSLKSDALGDPLICENAILALGLAEEKELSEIQATTLKVGELLGPSSPRGGWTSGTSSWSSGATGARSFWPTRSAPTPCGFARTGSLWTRTASAGTWGARRRPTRRS